MSWKSFEDFGEVQIYDRTSRVDVVPRIENAEIVLTNKAAFTKEIFDKLPKLRYLGVLATGFNVIDVDAARENGITVTNIPEYASYATAQMTLALLLEMTNHTAEHDLLVHAGSWTKCPDFCFWESSLTELWNKTIGLVGYGQIGRRVAVIAQALGMRVIVTSRSIETQFSRGDLKSLTQGNDGIIFASFEDLLAQSDVISVHCPLTPDTLGLICEKSISRMKDGVLLINTSRGKWISRR